MAIFKKIKKAFGFSESDYEEEENNEYIRSATVTPLNQRGKDSQVENPIATEHGMQNADAGHEQAIPKLPETVPDEIFDTVVSIFNSALPDFLKETIDKKSQREYIYNALSESMKKYITNLSDIAEKRTEMAWFNERSRLKTEMDSIQQKAKQIEDSSAEWKEQKLSAERQKRALSERVHDLEKQMAAYEAEKEQYELENKSLVNKLRAVSIQENDIEAMNQENSRLRDELAKLKAQETSANNTAETEQTIKELSETNLTLKNDLELLKKRSEIADAMINDLNHRASTAQKSLAEKESLLNEAQIELEKVKAELEKASSAPDIAGEFQQLKESNLELADKNRAISSDLEKANIELAKMKAELNESRETLNLFEESIDKFDQIKTARDSQISALQDQIKAKEQDLEAKDEEIRSLKSTIESNLKLQVSSEAILRQEIDSLKSSGEYQRPKRRKKAKISSIDESLDDTDWLIATPPEGTNARPSGMSDNEFGYQEPKKKGNPPENSAQMSLW